MIARFRNFENSVHMTNFWLKLKQAMADKDNVYVSGSMATLMVSLSVFPAKDEKDRLHKTALWAVKNLDEKKRVVYEVI